MRGKAVFARIDLGDGERNSLARCRGELSLAKRAKHADVTFERCRTRGDHAKQIRRDPELRFDSFEQRLRRGWRGFDGRRNWNA